MEDCVEKVINGQFSETSDLLERLERLKMSLEFYDGIEVKGHCPIVDSVLDALS